jgi:hypothetical protein
VGHDVGGVVPGYIAQIEGKTNDERFTSRIQFLNLEVVRYATPGPWSIHAAIGI